MPELNVAAPVVAGSVDRLALSADSPRGSDGASPHTGSCPHACIPGMCMTED